MQLLLVVFCFCVIVQTRATGFENTFQETDSTKDPELSFQPKPLPAKYSGIEKEVAPAPSPLVKLLDESSRKDLELSRGRGGSAEIPENLQLHVAGGDQVDGDARLKRSPHKHFKGCFFCGHGGGGYYPPPVYVQPVYAKPVYVQPVYVKPIVYTQPVYHKPVYSQPHYGSGCSTCGQWGGGSGSYSYSQSSASSSSYSYGYGKK